MQLETIFPGNKWSSALPYIYVCNKDPVTTISYCQNGIVFFMTQLSTDSSDTIKWSDEWHLATHFALWTILWSDLCGKVNVETVISRQLRKYKLCQTTAPQGTISPHIYSLRAVMIISVNLNDEIATNKYVLKD